MKYTARQIKEWDVERQVKQSVEGTLRQCRYIPARPENRLSLLGRIKLAWGVVTGRYDVLDWE